MSQALDEISLVANTQYSLEIPETPSPATALIITNTGLVPVKWSIGDRSGYIPNGTTTGVITPAANTVILFLATANTSLYITVWTKNDGSLQLPQGSPITNINLTPGTTVDANIVNSAVNVTGSVTANLPSGTTVDANITNATINVAGTISLTSGTTVQITTSSTSPPTFNLGSGNIVTVNDISGGTINELQTISPGNSLGALAVENNPLTPLSAPTVTNVGTAGTTSYFYQQRLVNQFGKTIASPIGSTTTGNATLSSTNYNNVAVQGLVVPSGIGGNLVYDSNLTNAIAPVGPTWVGRVGFTPTYGTADGDFNVLNPGTDNAEWVYYGAGASSATLAVVAAPIDVIPGETYTLSAKMNASNITGGSMTIQLYNSTNPSRSYLTLTQNNGSDTVISGQVTIPAGVTQVFPACQVENPTVSSGLIVSWSQIQLTQTDTVQPYQPGPLWTVQTFRGGFHVPALDTTLLVASDQGQAASVFRPSPFDTSGNIPQVQSTEIDTVLAPVDGHSPLYLTDNGSTYFSAWAAPIAMPNTATQPPDYFASSTASQWYIKQQFAQNAIIKQIMISATATNADPLCISLKKANGTWEYLGSYNLGANEFIFQMFGTTGKAVEAGDQLLLGSTATGGVWYVVVDWKYLE